ncbi:response regulator transcription factor [Anaerocolumna sp. MB42-C2]|uniref:response regulator transcription factor n=1 Tax=Anaerocolumna sp. MB42-C2 TaxID=3070997 RepID=UPI0027E161AB|nr:response regulator transcription factor [Anaerocolumna sp. MB42-C2]WMJ88213.1 response regulator transcription factor [Anaerocolumna sp. MB42-C2]
MYKVMIIEDNDSICRELSVFLQQNGFETITPSVFTQINEVIRNSSPDLILLDINLAGEDGFHLCQKIRKFSDLPVIFVTCRDSEEDELRGLLLGGDDFIRKPYHLPVLLARIRRILERYEKAHVLQVEDICLDVPAMVLKIKDHTIELSKNECRILYYLFINRGKTVTKDELIEALWENKLYVDNNILNVNISRLRKRLSAIGLSDFIKTVPQEGYII